ncbi:competence/damage-inducible protein CinA-like protein [Beggiatoa alba B18LD]|uniref:Competence/damage-inducible protein CinA-like protein n=1 Tax=Beggiatoa alba B18LD TaxID=395493 RepID=I3CIY1_9GAMM|nr:CinA family protein [Beggiatoa alba]EIJ43574.1 competence/damage-inducible protein CinA-like protein [Beggiatoa alba B18LD]
MPHDNLHSLAHQLSQQLLRHHYRLVTAESCTGGWIAQVMTAIAGSSDWFERGFVTYSNEAKQELLDVPAQILTEQGAVSEQTVLAMASGALKHSHAEVAIAVSGIAGPTGGSRTKPVGTVWIAWALPQKIYAKCFLFNGDRESVREQTVMTALSTLITELA